MAENLPPTATVSTPANADSTRGMPYYEKLRRDLRETLQKKRLLDKNMVSSPGSRALAALEDSIYRFEASYLEETGAGNIIKGFDNYIKGSSGTGAGTFSASTAGGGGGTAGRRKGVVLEQDRVFSRSSASFMRQESPPPSSAQTTPSHAPTPTSSFAPPLSARESNHQTPTSATSTKAGGGWKKNKKAGGGDKDDEGEAGDNVKQAKRLKISYGRD